jgi:hypothetical protein
MRKYNSTSSCFPLSLSCSYYIFKPECIETLQITIGLDSSTRWNLPKRANKTHRIIFSLTHSFTFYFYLVFVGCMSNDKLFPHPQKFYSDFPFSLSFTQIYVAERFIDENLNNENNLKLS